MTHADMAKRVEYAFIGKNAVGERKLRDQVFQFVWAQSDLICCSAGRLSSARPSKSVSGRLFKGPLQKSCSPVGIGLSPRAGIAR